MLTVKRPEDLSDHVGEEIGVGSWLLVDQDMIDRFAELSGDDQWIHVDAERAKTDMPGGRTIAHGLLTLCLSPRLSKGHLTVEELRMGVNYGINKLRFTAPAPVGARLRMRSRIVAVTPRPDGAVMVATERVVEIEGSEKPAMVAETVSLLYGV